MLVYFNRDMYSNDEQDRNLAQKSKLVSRE